ncbi:protein STAY-GREEN homolog, chloroplastic-like [Nymphaea colorata]|nr:protein STAY-GREEN homolog, chloroplastic-like [Nymphaea colorata]
MASMAVVPITTYSPQYSSQLRPQKSFLFLSRPAKKGKSASFATARLFGPSIFEASKLRVLFLGVDEEKHPGNLPRAYTITHSDITAKLTLAVSQTINRAQLQGWYNKLQRDEVVAEWKKMQGKMSLHVHCHISGGHLLLDFIANLRFYIFCKELPLVLKAVVHGDGNLFSKHPELEEALVWVYFHSNLKEFNRVECWGPLKNAAEGRDYQKVEGGLPEDWPRVDITRRPRRCGKPCACCFPSSCLIPWPQDIIESGEIQELQQQA